MNSSDALKGLPKISFEITEEDGLIVFRMYMPDIMTRDAGCLATFGQDVMGLSGVEQLIEFLDTSPVDLIQYYEYEKDKHGGTDLAS